MSLGLFQLHHYLRKVNVSKTSYVRKFVCDCTFASTTGSLFLVQATDGRPIVVEEYVCFPRTNTGTQRNIRRCLSFQLLDGIKQGTTSNTSPSAVFLDGKFSFYAINDSLDKDW
jgi:hypothetical protein